MGIKSIAKLLLASTVVAEQPNGVTDPIYDCTYDNTAAVYLDINIDGLLYKCGVNDTMMSAVKATIIEEASPTITLNGADDADFYTVMLLDNESDWIGPIIHELVTNVPGSDLKAGLTNTYPADVDVLIDYFRPDPPIPFARKTFSYLVYKQDNGDTDFSSWSVEDYSLFDFAGFATTYSLTFVTTNYFIAKPTMWSALKSFLNIWGAILGLEFLQHNLQ